MFQTRVSEILGIRCPVLEGGMSLAGNGELAAAVSNAGGLGIVSANPGWSDMNTRLENVRSHVRRARSLTSKPLAANVPLFFVDNFAQRHIQMLIEERIDVVTTSGGSPKVLTPMLKAAGIKVIHVVGNVKQALDAQRAGVDIVVCEGYEAGGIESPDELTTLVLTPLIADAVEIPVVAAGGIADGRGFMAALSLGAEGVQMGTAFLAASECHVHPNLKQAIVDAPDQATVMTQRALGRLSRVLRTELSMKMAELDRRGAVDELKALIASVPRSLTGDAPTPNFNGQYRGQMQGDLVTGEAAAGQSAALVRSVRSAHDIIHDMLAQAEQIARRWAGLAGGGAAPSLRAVSIGAKAVAA